MIIAMDGPAGCGKSTIAKLLAERLGYTYINSGSLYRAITLMLLRNNIDINNQASVIEYSKTIELNYQNGKLYHNKELLEDVLRSPQVEANVSQISAIVPIRHIVNDLIRSLAKNINAVVEGRDICTVVFPDAEAQFYIDASVEARANRRYLQNKTQSLDEIRQNIEMRDKIDRNKAEGSLKKAEKALYIDTSYLTIEQVYDIVVGKIKH